MSGVVDMADVVLSVDGKGFDVEFAGGCQDTRCDLASEYT